MNKIFLSHRGVDKPLVRQYRDVFESVGLECWIDEEDVAAGVELDRRLRQGFRESCAAVFFVTPSFEESGYLRTEITHALRERQAKADGFVIISLVLRGDDGRSGAVPESLRDFVWKEPDSQLEAAYEVLRALPIQFQAIPRFRKIDPFWKPFVVGPTSVVVSRHREFSEFEPSGFVGFGCAMALAEVKAQIQILGGKATVTYHDRMTGEELAANLILLGGPDANSATMDVVSRIPTTIAFGDPESRTVSITDRSTGTTYSPQPRSGLSELTLDYGAILRAPNPFGNGTSVLVLAGSFGFGTWAAAKFAASKDFLERQDVQSSPAFECLIETSVVKDAAHVRGIVVARPLGTPLPNSGLQQTPPSRSLGRRS